MIPPGADVDAWKLIAESAADWRAYSGLAPQPNLRLIWLQENLTFAFAAALGGVMLGWILRVPSLAVIPLTLMVAGVLSAVLSFPRDRWHRAAVRRVLRRYGVPVCVRCGYDLRPTPQADRCPECGEANLGAGSESPS
jgi:hypothetical protein